MIDHSFSGREKEVVNLLLQGRGNKQIALELGIANRTVEFHLSNIYAKLGVNTRAEAILKLTSARLRESTGGLWVDSTVADSGGLTDNGFHAIARRLSLKKPPIVPQEYIAIGILMAVILAVIIIIPRFAPQDPAQAPAPPSGISTGAGTETALPAVQVPTSIPAATAVPPHTVNGHTAAIEWMYADSSHILFHVRITGGGEDIPFGDARFFDRIGGFDLFDEYGRMVNTSGGSGPAIDPAIHQFEFVPVTLLKGDRFKGQFAFDLNNAPDYASIRARFRFDVDLPIQPDVRFYPKHTATANGLEILLDSVTVTPDFTQIYVCFPTPSFADWQIGSQTALRLDGREANPTAFRLLFDSGLGGDRSAGSEPYWVPPIKQGRCIRSIFPMGSENPDSLTLTIPQLEKTDPEILVRNDFSTNYPGLTAKEAYYTYLEEQGNIYKGPWIFNIELER